MRRHLGWIIPIAILIVLFLGVAVLGGVTANAMSADSPEALTLVLTQLIVWPLVAIAAVICIVVAIRSGIRTAADARRRSGILTPQERAALAERHADQDAWAAATMLVEHVREERIPSPITVWGLIPARDEVFFYDVDARYERFYGTTVEYRTQNTMYLGRPSFVMAGLAVDAVANASAKSAAMRQAAEQWREQQPARILISNQRLAVFANGQWLSFPFETMSACYPAPEVWSVTFEFPGVAPMRLVGRGAPLIAVWSVLATHGRVGVEQHPGLAPLRLGPPREPTLSTE